jgi:hypothetical protein
MDGVVHTDGDDCGRGIIPGRLVRLSGEAARVGAPAPCPPDSEPHLELIRDGDVLQAIDVICACGKRIRLRCVYADAPH